MRNSIAPHISDNSHRYGLLGILLALVMAVLLLPATAYAAEGDVEINEGNFPDVVFREFIKGKDTDADGYLSAAEISRITQVKLENQGITSLKGIEYLTSLYILNCNDNKLTSLDVSKNTVLGRLYCNYNKLTSLDLSNNTQLQDLQCEYNQLTTLDVSNKSRLTGVYCDNNKLTSINVTNSLIKQTSLLSCSYNQLTSIDVSTCAGLYTFNCDHNQLTSIDVSSNPILSRLNCNNNRITTLDVSNKSKLYQLYCNNNQLTELNIKGNSFLYILECKNNKLASLDVNTNTNLSRINCSDNQLSTLDVSKNTKLTNYLTCDNNRLTELDVSANTLLQKLSCKGNHLTSLNLGSNSSLSASKVTATDESYTVSGRTVDMTALPGNFDLNKLDKDSIVGGTVDESGILTIDEGVTEVTYDYDCGNGITVTFKLTLTADPDDGSDGDDDSGTDDGEAADAAAPTPSAPCHHDYEWETHQTATALKDGVMRYRCIHCGDVEYEVPVAAYYVFNKETQEAIRNAEPGATVTVSTPIFISFHEMVADALTARSDVSLVVEYRHDGRTWQMTIPAGSGSTLETLFGESQYAGFLYLGGVFTTVEK